MNLMLILYFTLGFCREYYIKLYEKELYLTGNEKIEELPKLGDFKNKVTVVFEPSKDSTSHKVIKLKSQNDFVFDNAAARDDLIFFPKHGLPNQQFVMIPLNFINSYMILNADKCLTWEESRGFFKFNACEKSDPNQVFEFICADCPNITSINLVPQEINDKPVTIHEHFLDPPTIRLIRSIGHLVSDLSKCYENNGTCRALDNHHEKLYCYSPFHNTSKIVEVWPDLNMKKPHVDDLYDNPLFNQTLTTDLHAKLVKLSDEEKHLVREHPNEMISHLPNDNHQFTQEDVFHRILPDFEHHDVFNKSPSVQSAYNFGDLPIFADKVRQIFPIHGLIDERENPTDSILKCYTGNQYADSIADAAKSQISALQEFAGNFPQAKDNLLDAAHGIANVAKEKVGSYMNSLFQ